MNKNKTILDAKKFLNNFGEEVVTKFTNVCSKTGQYDVPIELYQKRTSRSNRALIEWKVVRDNNLTLQQLETFSGGVVVEFVNDDFFDEENFSIPLFTELKNRIGSDKIVSAIITIRAEEGSSSSDAQRKSFEKLTNNTKILYKGKEVVINKKNFCDFAITQIKNGKKGCGVGNEFWSGFLFVSIKGGQQDTIETHKGKQLTLFNPACEFATKEVCDDLNLVCLYFMFTAVQFIKLSDADKLTYETIFSAIKNDLKSSEYDSPSYKGNLLDYCESHLSVKMTKGRLTDPIQVRRIPIENFNIKDRTPDSIDFTHDEAVFYKRYYWDKKKNCILSPARPTNIFWSFHLSNMMQQNFSLEEYFKDEKRRYLARQEISSDG